MNHICITSAHNPSLFHLSKSQQTRRSSRHRGALTQQPKFPNSSTHRVTVLHDHQKRAIHEKGVQNAESQDITMPFASRQTKEEEEEEEEEEDREGSHFIEVGYISKVHGLKGELRVFPSTDFPELRLSKPGKRWLRTRILGKEVISQVELTGGRDHPGQKSWIISLRGIDTVDQAKQIVGSTLLVREVDRPDLEEGEFYTRDLVGMRVVLKETGRLVGEVTNVFNFGASDLLQVLLKSTEEEFDHSNPSNPVVGATRQTVWVPFVEAIVPDVDINGRELHITPPKGLLELNLRKHVKTKTERRQLEWKERKKLKHRFTAAKKKLSEMGQNHVLEYLKVGGKAQKNLLIKQIVEINYKLFQHAVQSINTPSDSRLDLSIYSKSALLQENTLKISPECLSSCASKENSRSNYELHQEGLILLAKSKVAILVVTDNDVNASKDFDIDGVQTSKSESRLVWLQQLIVDYKRLLEVEGQDISIPLIVVSPAHEIRSYEDFLLDRGYFGLDNQKIWIVEEEQLPIVDASTDGKKILMKSSCEILQAPTGSRGVFSLLSSDNLLGKLIEMGVEYVQIRRLVGSSRPAATESSFLFGWVESRGADIGFINTQQDKIEEADEFNMLFSVRHLNNMCKHIDEQQFFPVAEQHAHVELVRVGEDYVEKIHPVPDKPNSYRFSSSIYSAFNFCSPSSVAVVLITSDKL